MDIDKVTHGLIADDSELLALYQNNAYFKFGVDSLVRGVLPTFLRGLAEEAREKNDKMQADIERLKFV